MSSWKLEDEFPIDDIHAGTIFERFQGQIAHSPSAVRSSVLLRYSCLHTQVANYDEPWFAPKRSLLVDWSPEHANKSAQHSHDAVLCQVNKSFAFAHWPIRVSVFTRNCALFFWFPCGFINTFWYPVGIPNVNELTGLERVLLRSQPHGWGAFASRWYSALRFATRTALFGIATGGLAGEMPGLMKMIWKGSSCTISWHLQSRTVVECMHLLLVTGWNVWKSCRFVFARRSLWKQRKPKHIERSILCGEFLQRLTESCWCIWSSFSLGFAFWWQLEMQTPMKKCRFCLIEALHSFTTCCMKIENWEAYTENLRCCCRRPRTFGWSSAFTWHQWRCTFRCSGIGGAAPCAAMVLCSLASHRTHRDTWQIHFKFAMPLWSWQGKRCSTTDLNTI